jgi:cation diffusion facilitator CzcD-associated flavoprotein CzcO
MLGKIDTVIVGGGQAGLAISYHLTQEGREHVALERAPAVANAWRNQRWDSFTLVTSNFQIRMPGAEYSGNDPYEFMSLAEISSIVRATVRYATRTNSHKVEASRASHAVHMSRAKEVAALIEEAASHP